MQKSFNNTGVFLIILSMISLIVMSYVNESIFMDRILLCCFIFGAAILASKRNGLRRIDSKQKKG